MTKTPEALSIINGKSLLEQEFEPPKFIVTELMPTGLHILSGHGKIGKSWFSLWLCQQVANGLPVWEFETLKCETLYLALEDPLRRIHFRLSQITETGSEHSFFATESENLSGSLIPQLEAFMQDHPNTGLIIIDTLQCVRGRGNAQSAYANDYEEMGRLKAFADHHDIAVLIIHHTRKMPDSDPFNMVSGSVGIVGAADGVYVLEKERRSETQATLHITGRDIEDRQLLLAFDRERKIWNFVSYLSGEKNEDRIITAVVSFMTKRKAFDGTASELLGELKNADGDLRCSPNVLTRKLKEQALTLEKRHNILVEFSRKKDARMVSLLFVGDDDDKNIYGGTPEISSSAAKGDGDDDDIYMDAPQISSPVPTGDDGYVKTSSPSPRPSDDGISDDDECINISSSSPGEVVNGKN